MPEPSELSETMEEAYASMPCHRRRKEENLPQSFYFHERQPSEGDPGGVTVSKTGALPEGDFKITEFCWPDVTLWFIDDQRFTPGDREVARLAVYETPLCFIASR